MDKKKNPRWPPPPKSLRCLSSESALTEVMIKAVEIKIKKQWKEISK